MTTQLNGHAPEVTEADDALNISPMDMVDLVAQALLDKIEERKHVDAFLDHVIARARTWQSEMGATATIQPHFAPTVPEAPKAGERRKPLYHKYEDDDFSCLRTRLLVSCFKSGIKDGGIFELDFASNSYRQVIHCDGRGIAQYKDGYLIASRDQGLFVLDNDLNIIRNHPMKPLDLHGVAEGPNGLVYLVETRHNRVGIYRMEPFERIDEIVVSSDAEDRNHVNDLCFQNGKLLLSMFSTQEMWRENVKAKVFDGAIIEYDLESKTPTRIVASGLQMPHTLKLVNDDLYYCESFGLNVMQSGAKIAQFFGYTRGIDSDGRYLFIGQSRLRNRSRHAEVTLSSDAGIHILEPSEHTSRFIPLPTPDVYGVQVLD